MGNSFKIMKTILAAVVILAYPNHDKSVHICSDCWWSLWNLYTLFKFASNFKMGAVFLQQKHPNKVHWWIKLSKTQYYGERTSSIVIILEQCCTMLVDAEVFISTNNITLTSTWTVAESSAGIWLWKRMVLSSSITLAWKMSLPIYCCGSHAMMRCPF